MSHACDDDEWWARTFALAAAAQADVRVRELPRHKRQDISRSYIILVNPPSAASHLQREGPEVQAAEAQVACSDGELQCVWPTAQGQVRPQALPSFRAGSVGEEAELSHSRHAARRPSASGRESERPPPAPTHIHPVVHALDADDLGQVLEQHLPTSQASSQPRPPPPRTVSGRPPIT